MSLIKGSTPLANGTGMVSAKIYTAGTYTCVATNKAGSSSRDFTVTLTGLFCLNYVGTKCKFVLFEIMIFPLCRLAPYQVSKIGGD